MQFDNRDAAHATIVKKTRQKKWYAEDLFARFTIQNDRVIKSWKRKELLLVRVLQA